jgi:Lrp/AsnC family transcriptional regulator, leucine-responsive regulatory protein
VADRIKRTRGKGIAILPLITDYRGRFFLMYRHPWLIMPDFDNADARILRTLQADGRLSNQDLAERVNLSASPCWRRVRRLEEGGVITGYRATLDRRALGLGVLAFVRVQIDSHTEADARRFEDRVLGLEEVVACYAITGESDFLLQIVAPDLESFGTFAMTVIRRLPGIKEMHSSLVLRELKTPGALPVREAAAG